MHETLSLMDIEEEILFNKIECFRSGYSIPKRNRNRFIKI